jgi:CheY-like chemotaxis protein
VTDTPDRSPSGWILFVEDSAMVGRVIVESLKFEGVTVVLAPTAADAWRELEQSAERFALVLCDQKLPDLTGLELLARVRAAYPSLRLVLTTGFASAQVQEEVLQFDGLLTKPFGVADVLELLRDASD